MTGPADTATGSALIGLLVVIVIEITHHLLPKGTHFTFMDRFLSKDDDEENDDEG